MDEMEPGKRDHAHQELSGLCLVGWIDGEFGHDGAECFLGRFQVRRQRRQMPAAVECLALEEPHEIRIRCDEIEVLANRSCQNHFRRLGTRQRPLAPAAYGCTYPFEAALQDVAVELFLGSEEVTRCTSRHSSRRTHIGEARGIVATLGEEVLRGGRGSPPSFGRRSFPSPGFVPRQSPKLGLYDCLLDVQQVNKCAISQQVRGQPVTPDRPARRQRLGRGCLLDTAGRAVPRYQPSGPPNEDPLPLTG